MTAESPMADNLYLVIIAIAKSAESGYANTPLLYRAYELASPKQKTLIKQAIDKTAEVNAEAFNLMAVKGGYPALPKITPATEYLAKRVRAWQSLSHVEPD